MYTYNICYVLHILYYILLFMTILCNKEEKQNIPFCATGVKDLTKPSFENSKLVSEFGSLT